MMAQDAKEVFKVIRDYLGEDMLSAENPYVPEFVRRALCVPLRMTDRDQEGENDDDEEEDAGEDAVDGWAVATYRFVLHDVAVDMCTASPYDDAHDDELPFELLRTVIYGLDCFERAAYLIDPEALQEHPSSLRVVCLLLNEDRDFPEKQAPIGVENINGGVTMSLHDGDERRVFVYRREHARKVLLHELAHAMGVDAFLTSDAVAADEVLKTESRIGKRLNWSASLERDGRFRIVEALVETVACYWHMMMHVPEHSLSRDLDSRTARNELWATENAQYLASCAAVLRHYSSSSSALESRRSRRNAESHTDTPHIWLERVRGLGIEEDAHVLAYYFVKAALWCRLDDLVLLLRRDAECRLFLQLVENSLTDPAFWRRVLRSGASDRPRMTALD